MYRYIFLFLFNVNSASVQLLTVSMYADKFKLKQVFTHKEFALGMSVHNNKHSKQKI